MRQLLAKANATRNAASTQQPQRKRRAPSGAAILDTQHQPVESADVDQFDVDDEVREMERSGDEGDVEHSVLLSSGVVGTIPPRICGADASFLLDPSLVDTSGGLFQLDEPTEVEVDPVSQKMEKDIVALVDTIIHLHTEVLILCCITLSLSLSQRAPNAKGNISLRTYGNVLVPPA
jgi:hypothetical protein